MVSKDSGNFWLKFTTLVTVFLGIIFQLFAFIFNIYVAKLDQIDTRLTEVKSYLDGEKPQWEYLKKKMEIGAK